MIGHPELPGRLDADEAQRELGRDVDQVGPEARQVGGDLPLPRKGPLHVGIEEERDAGRAVDLGSVGAGPAGRG